MPMNGIDITRNTLKRVTINPTELCNRKCSFCPRVDPNIYPNRNLEISLDIINVLYDQLNYIDYQNEIFITGFGEPLLHSKLVDVCSAISTLPGPLYIVSNGDKLNTSLARRLLHTGVTNIIVSLYDGPTSRFKDINSELGSEFIKTRNRYDISHNNIDLNLNNRAGLVDAGPDLDGSMFRECYIPFNKCQIDWNGNVLICDQDWSREGIVGNIINTPIYDIWSGDNMNSYRKHLLKGTRVKTPCNKCNATGTIYGKESFDIFAELLK